MKNIIFVLILAISQRGDGGPSKRMEFNLERAYNEIIAAPSWMRMSEDNIGDDGPKLLKILKKYMEVSPEAAHRLVARLSVPAKANGKGAPMNYDIAGKIYIYNRLYCKVPKMVNRANWVFFGGWGGIPGDQLRLNALYPLTVGKDGSLALTETSGGYYGPNYRGLEEFDYLLSRFGKRTQGKSKPAKTESK